ncbi:No apical meristem (NAM) protein [Corchorus capsularis]|uniref:No apical meristem (NAM) protein n=1 Tax=Corchorus capsularis TaxID=210143 RepID=A0A1R3GGK9_COCAP|nr:No apical meristem (NAM) protein [Corchorus capsularis]
MEEDGSSMKQLPPGFRFCPTDEELVLHFLYPKALLLPNNCQYPNFLPQLDLHQLLPWELHGKALLSGNQYFFFSKIRMGNYGVCSREINGYWKELLDMEEPIFNNGAAAGTKVGIKKLFVFNIGEEAPFAIQTNWLMQQYHLCYDHLQGNNKLADSTWVLCRVHESTNKGNSQSMINYSDEDEGTELSCLDEMFLSLDDDEDLDDITSMRLFGM